MVIGDQHPLYVMCDTDIPYQLSDGDRGSTSIISHVTHISCINQVMVIGNQHPLYVMCDTDIPYQLSDGDRGSTSIICHV